MSRRTAGDKRPDLAGEIFQYIGQSYHESSDVCTFRMPFEFWTVLD